MLVFVGLILGTPLTRENQRSQNRSWRSWRMGQVSSKSPQKIVVFKVKTCISVAYGGKYPQHPCEQPGIPWFPSSTYVGLTVPGRCFLKSKQHFPTSGPKSKPRRDCEENWWFISIYVGYVIYDLLIYLFVYVYYIIYIIDFIYIIYCLYTCTMTYNTSEPVDLHLLVSLCNLASQAWPMQGKHHQKTNGGF